MAFRLCVACLLVTLCSCTGRPLYAAPPTDPAIIGAWRWAKVDDQRAPFPFLLKFRKDGRCNSGPTPFALMQRSTYTFDGNRIVILHDGERRRGLPLVAALRL